MAKKPIIIGLVAVILLAGAGIFMWKKEEVKKPENSNVQEAQSVEPGKIDMSDWRTYRYDEFNFIIECPNDLKEIKLPFNKIGIGFGKNPDSHDLAIQYFENFDSLEWDSDGKEKSLESYIQASNNIKETKKIDFKGNEAYIGHFENNIIDYKGVDLFMQNKNHIYIISFRGENLNKIQKQILSTLRFID